MLKLLSMNLQYLLSKKVLLATEAIRKSGLPAGHPAGQSMGYKALGIDQAKFDVDALDLDKGASILAEGFTPQVTVSVTTGICREREISFYIVTIGVYTPESYSARVKRASFESLSESEKARELAFRDSCRVESDVWHKQHLSRNRAWINK